MATLGVGSLLTWLLVVLVYYLGSVGPTLGYFRGLLAFGESAGALMSMDAYLADALSQNPPDAALLAFVLPALFAVSAVLLPRRLVSLALLAGSSLATAVAFRRFYTATFVELNAFMFASLAIWAVVVVTPWLRARDASACRPDARSRSPGKACWRCWPSFSRGMPRTASRASSTST
jgi:hypothetical protein